MRGCNVGCNSEKCYSTFQNCNLHLTSYSRARESQRGSVSRRWGQKRQTSQFHVAAEIESALSVSWTRRDSVRWSVQFAFFFSIFSSSAFRRSELTCLHSPLCGKCTSWHSGQHYRATWQRLNLVWEHAYVWPAPHQFRRSILGNGCTTSVSQRPLRPRL